MDLGKEEGYKRPNLPSVSRKPVDKLSQKPQPRTQSPDLLKERLDTIERRERQMTRRRFLRLTGIIGAGVALESAISHIPNTRIGITRDLWEILESGTLGESSTSLKKLIEEQFNVRFLAPSDGVTGVKVASGESSLERKVQEAFKSTVEWDLPRLKALALTLKDLPPNFYAPKRNEKGVRFPLKIALIESHPLLNRLGVTGMFGEKMVSLCICSSSGTGPEDQIIVFEKGMLGQTLLERQASRWVIVHEFTHYITSSDINKYIQAICKPIGLGRKVDLKRAFTSEMSVRKIYKRDKNGEVEVINLIIKGEDVGLMLDNPNLDEEPIFIGKSLAISPDLIKVKGQTYVNQFLSQNQEEQERLREKGYVRFLGLSYEEAIETKSDMGYGATNFQEFFSTASEYYAQGKSKFVNTYKQFLGEERAMLLYEGVKRELFMGREY